MSEQAVERNELLTLTSDIVANHASKNAVPSTDLSGLIETVFNTLSGLGAPAAEPEQKPAVPIKKSVTKQFIFCSLPHSRQVMNFLLTDFLIGTAGSCSGSAGGAPRPESVLNTVAINPERSVLGTVFFVA